MGRAELYLKGPMFAFWGSQPRGYEIETNWTLILGRHQL